jgi:YHS domain-containing protein
MKKEITAFGVLVTILCVLMVCVSGCKKDAEPVEQSGHAGHSEGMEQSAMSMIETAKETTNTINEALTEQTMCPVMGGEVNKDLFVEYKGKKVYFCCGGCENKFLESPEKYMSKLPQFK